MRDHQVTRVGPVRSEAGSHPGFHSFWRVEALATVAGSSAFTSAASASGSTLRLIALSFAVILVGKRVVRRWLSHT